MLESKSAVFPATMDARSPLRTATARNAFRVLRDGGQALNDVPILVHKYRESSWPNKG